MNNYYIWPDRLTFINYFFMAAILLIITAFIVLIIRINRSNARKERNYLIMSGCKRFELNDYQTNLINHLADRIGTMSVTSFFYNENYYDEQVIHYIKMTGNSGKNLLNEFKNIKHKINFNEIVPLTTRDMPVNQNVKIRLARVGFISGKVIHNDSEGVLISVYFKDAVKKAKSKNQVSVYYWDDIYQYESHSVIKKIAMLNYIQYILINHAKLTIKNKKTQGYAININMSVYFTHIFKLPKNPDIKQHYFKGNINTFSMIGAEIFTNFKVTPIGIFLFEFENAEISGKKYHFTGKVAESNKLKNGKLMFVKYLDMNDECRNYIFNIITERMNEIH